MSKDIASSATTQQVLSCVQNGVDYFLAPSPDFGFRFVSGEDVKLKSPLLATVLSADYATKVILKGLVDPISNDRLSFPKELRNFEVELLQMTKEIGQDNFKDLLLGNNNGHQPLDGLTKDSREAVGRIMENFTLSTLEKKTSFSLAASTAIKQG